MASPADNRWQRLEQLFYEALDREPEARPTFLDEACGEDLELRKELESLLESSDKTLGFLQKPVHDAALHVRESATAGRRIGAYKILSLIGEGGMGSVYLACRADELYQQQVAIKLMHAGSAQTRRTLLRFRAERQILANLSHPNIARLLDGGVTDDGLPYLVMEYVAGIRIDEYCRRRALPTEERLRLFCTVCEAVEYAHKHLVIHRDIKPANILVTQEAVPKLLDFGIAKLLDPDLGELGLTGTTERMMTPDYASPEQVLGEPVTTATDVYALGVLLYELLAGRRPFKLETTNPVEVLRTICEQIPQLPSEISKSNVELAPPDASRRLKGDLDNIVLMAMRKEPARRYPSVSQLAGDVQAYLDGYPVHARTETWSYRSGKFIRRHKTGVAATGIVALALIGFSIAMGLSAKRATRDRRIAEREAEFLNSIFQASTPDQARGQQVTARELLDRGAQRIDRELAGEPQLQAAMLDNVGRAYTALGLYSQAEALLQRAYDLRRKNLGDENLDTAASLDGLATAIRLENQYQRAEPLFRQALAIRQKKLGLDHPQVAESLANLGECLYLLERNTEAEAYLRRGLRIQRGLSSDSASATENYLALVLEQRGDYREATPLLQNAVAIDRRIDPDGPNYAISLHNLTGALIDTGDLSQAETMERQVLALRRKIDGPGHPDLAYSLNNLGFILLEKGDWQAARPFLQENLAIRRSQSDKDPRLAAALNNWARMLQEKGDYLQAENVYHQAVVMLQETTGPTGWTIAKVITNLGTLELDRGRYTDAEHDEREAVQMSRKLGREESPQLATSLIDLALARSFQGDPAGAEPLLRQALAIRQKELAPPHPAIISAQVRLGEVLVDRKKLEQAEPILREAVASAHSEPFALLPWQVAEAESVLGVCLAAEGHSTEAKQLIQNNQAALKAYPEAALRKELLRRVTAVQ